MGITLKAEGTSRAPIDAAEVLRAASILFAPETCHELRGLPSGRSRLVQVGDDAGLLAATADLADGHGVYFSLNPVRSDLGDHGAKNADVLRRRWLLIDCDPAKAEKDSSATDGEKGSASLLCAAVEQALSELGWPDPLVIDSGNGYHLLYRLDLPNDEDSRKLLAAVLKRLAEAHDTPGASIDRKVHNAARISKLPGTWARKGTHTPERPHRLARLLSVPDHLRPVSVGLIASLVSELAEAAEAPADEDPAPRMKLRATDDNGYAAAALEREIGKVATSATSRNNQLYESALKLAGYVAGGHLDGAEVRRQLVAAAEHAGLGRDGDPGEIARAIDNAFGVGMETPKAVPDDGTRAKGKAKQGRPIPEPDETVIVRASSIRPKRLEWFMPGRIPLGKLTTFAGWGGLGKTFATIDIAARASSGGELPLGDGECFEPSSVVILNVEDDPEDTTVPRLIESGADLDRVTFLKEKWLGQFQLSDLDLLGRAVEQTRHVKLVVVDPATAYLGGLDDHKNARLRSILAPLGLFAAHYRLAVVLITHVTKSGGADQKTSAAAKIIGSVAWVNAVRSAFMFVKDPLDPSRRLFLNVKNNLGPTPPGMAYRIAPTETLARVEWLGCVDTTADEAVQQEAGPREVDPDRAAGWLAEFLAGGARPSKECLDRGNAALGVDRGLDWWRDKIYKGKLGGKPLHQGHGTTAVWVWGMPARSAANGDDIADVIPF